MKSVKTCIIVAEYTRKIITKKKNLMINIQYSATDVNVNTITKCQSKDFLSFRFVNQFGNMAEVCKILMIYCICFNSNNLATDKLEC